MKRQIKKTLPILLLVGLVVSLIAIGTAAPTYHAKSGVGTYGPLPTYTTAQLNQYYSGVQAADTIGEQAGISDGYNQGQADCQAGQTNTGGKSQMRAGHMQPASTSPYAYGYADGYNKAYDRGWKSSQGYESGYTDC